MHSAVLQNKKYMKFAEDNTVEVLALGRLEEGVEKEDPKAAKYKAKDEQGNEVEYMVSWPNLTFDQIQALRSSPAGQYNDTGGIPYTAFVNPHTLQKMSFIKGGTSSKAVMEAAEEAKKQLEEEHGKGLSRDELKRNSMAIAKAREEVADGDYDGAIKMLEKAGHGKDKTHEVLAAKLQTAHDEVIAAARARFDEIKEMDTREQKRELNRFISKNKKTGLEDEIRAQLLSLKEAD